MLVKPRYEKHVENISRFGTPLNVIARGWGNTLVSLGSACFKTLAVRKKR